MPQEGHKRVPLIAVPGAKLVLHAVHLPLERAHPAKVGMQFRHLLLAGDLDDALHELVDGHFFEPYAVHGFNAQYANSALSLRAKCCQAGTSSRLEDTLVQEVQ